MSWQTLALAGLLTLWSTAGIANSCRLPQLPLLLGPTANDGSGDELEGLGGTGIGAGGRGQRTAHAKAAR